MADRWGVCGRAVEAAPEVGRTTWRQLAEAHECAICLERTRRVFRTPCGHMFHTTCLRKHHAACRARPRREPRCPLCREPFALLGHDDDDAPSASEQSVQDEIDLLLELLALALPLDSTLLDGVA